MIFFEGYTFGRIANSAVKTLGRFCTGANVSRALDDDMTRALKFLQARVEQGKPLCIEPAMHDTWFIFTDGACSPELREGSIGGILYDPAGHCTNFFGEKVPQHLMDSLFENSQNPIHELEVLPVLVAAELWGSHFAHAQIVYYIDNESARMAYIKGLGETAGAGGLIQSFVQLESDFQHRVWFGRVPSHSNPADSPSRLSFDAVLSLGASRTSVDWEMVSCHLKQGCGAKLGRC